MSTPTGRSNARQNLYGTGVPTREQKQAVDDANEAALKQAAASGAGFSPPTESARDNPGLLKQRVALFNRMTAAGVDGASKMREEARGLDISTSGFNTAMGKIPDAPVATPTTPPVTTPTTPPVTGSTMRKAATDVEYEAARRAEYKAAPDYQAPGTSPLRPVTTADRVGSILEEQGVNALKSKYNFDPSVAPPAALSGSPTPKPENENYTRFREELNKGRRARGEVALPGTSGPAKERATIAEEKAALDADPLGLGGSQMDRARAQVIADMVSRSAQPGSGTRSDILDEINKGRVAEGKAPVKIDWKDVAAVDKKQSEKEYEAARNKAIIDRSTGAAPESPDAITARKLRGEAIFQRLEKEEADAKAAEVAKEKKDRENERLLAYRPPILGESDENRMAEEGAARRGRRMLKDDPYTPTSPEQLAADEEAQKYADETRAADALRRSRKETIKRANPLKPRGILDDLRYLAEGISTKHDEVGTAFYNFRKDPNEPRMLTRAEENARNETELRKARGGR